MKETYTSPVANIIAFAPVERLANTTLFRTAAAVSMPDDIKVPGVGA